MAAMSTTLTEFSDKENSRTYTLSGTTAQKPRYVIQKRSVPAGNQTVAQDTITVYYATVDADGLVLPSKISMSVQIRRPVDGQSTDVDAALVILRDIVAGDEFGNTVDTQEYLI